MTTLKMIALAGGPSGNQATLLMTQMESFGLSFRRDCKNEEDLLKWEGIQSRLQSEQEQLLMYAIHKFEFKNPVVLVDRTLPRDYLNKAQFDLLVQKASMCNRVPLDRYYGVIYMRTTTVEEQKLLYNRHIWTKEEWEKVWKDMEQIRRRNEEVWSQHTNFLLVDVSSKDKFRKKLQMACVNIAQLLDFELKRGLGHSYFYPSLILVPKVRLQYPGNPSYFGLA
ncbi:unnamed protein product [Haemonchus placei]|uniref:AAA_28 domain-containing protein n=1 Tax=Haemonchus placei TaxID=6290 RepID=A0A0N4WAH4_HAEPC|nr:unnamed protein product [Haemonchus placei]